eukprot:9821493-Alexandrium_andersonii.AAC.1
MCARKRAGTHRPNKKCWHGATGKSSWLALVPQSALTPFDSSTCTCACSSHQVLAWRCWQSA